MKITKKIALLLILISSVIHAQKRNSKTPTMNQTTLEELNMTVYEKDSTANALVLYEGGSLFNDELNNFNFTTDYYRRVKIFNKNGEGEATISLKLYKKERVFNIKAVTYNLTDAGTIKKTYLQKKDIYKKKLNDTWTEVTFTLPNIKKGSVIEYKYSITSPYNSIDDWYYQSDIPKVYSQFDAAILGNYKFNVRIIGFLKLTRQESSVKKRCAFIPGVGNGACGVISYGIQDIPAFKEEKYMTSKKNFMSRLVLDLKSFTEVSGRIIKYTNTWKNADKTLKTRFLNNQTSKNSFFRKKLPEEVLSLKDPLEKARRVYTFIRDHYSWNDKYWSGSEIKIKKAFEERSGSVADINLSLYNSLKAAGIKTYIVMLSTRDNGLPTNLYPVIHDFNYLLVKIVVDGKEFFLDATNKYAYFGQVPFQCLNGKARVLDFKRESFWQEIPLAKKTSINTRVQLSLDDADDFVGKMSISRTGYRASQKRETLASTSEEEYLEEIENTGVNLLIEEYKNSNLDALEKPIRELFTIRLENDSEDEDIIRMNPFIVGKTTENPFKLKERNYPVDFGYPEKYTYNFRLTVPDQYQVTRLPENRGIKLPNGGGSFIMKVNKIDQRVEIYLKFSIGKSVFTNIEYHYLKEFYKQLIEAESSFVELRRKG